MSDIEDRDRRWKKSMHADVKRLAKTLVPLKARVWVANYLARRETLKPIAPRKCPLCDFEGWFDRFGRPPRLDALCPRCGSLERHRLLHLAMERGEIDEGIDRNSDEVLHFAAEPQLERIFRKQFINYKTADLFEKADLKINLEAIDLPDGKYRLIIANHVLEHVDDFRAASEIARILSDDGIFVAMVPIVEGWDESYENGKISDEAGRWLHFGQGDHVRYYGRDFRERIERGGLKLKREITATEPDVATYGLTRGEKVFVFGK